MQEIQLNYSFLHNRSQRSHKSYIFQGWRLESQGHNQKQKRANKKQIQQKEACLTARKDSLPSALRHCYGNRASTHHQRKQTAASKLSGKPRNVRY